MISSIIPISLNNITKTQHSKTKLILNHLSITSQTEIKVTQAFHKLFKNNPTPNTQQTQNQIIQAIIQIKILLGDKDSKVLTNSAINMALSRLKKGGVLRYIGGYYTLNEGIIRVLEADQIVFRFGDGGVKDDPL